MPDSESPRPAPPRLSTAALSAARATRRPPGTVPSLGDADGRGVREVILAHHPALPLTMIAEAVAYVISLD
jgi:hypothetical protein